MQVQISSALKTSAFGTEIRFTKIYGLKEVLQTLGSLYTDLKKLNSQQQIS